MRELSLSNKPRLIISSKLLQQIVELHAKVGDIEWSGALMFEVLSGGIEDLDNLKIQAQAVYPMNVGSETYTEFEFGTKIIDISDVYPEYLDGKYRIGTVHTHHSMSTFFSGVDTGDLHTNAPNHHYYVSLIVNHKTKYCAKIAYVAEHVQDSPEYINFKGTKIPLNTKPLTEKVLVTMDCDIEIEWTDSVFSTRVDEIIKEREVEIANKPKYPVVNRVFVGDSIANSTKGKTPYPSKFTFEDILLDEVIELGGEADVDTFLQEERIEKFILKVLGKQSVGYDLFEVLEDIDDRKFKLVDKRKFTENFIKYSKTDLAEYDPFDIIDECITLVRFYKGDYKSAEKVINLLDEMYEEVK